ncbi:MAG: MBL fold metallo-hydrolase [Dehalococcoidales bacterium]|jgi:7,8-dihydropterin-6-yl-methyl-4-(beta-D-ribofuranosyl)aminobenzene 5'-phosphate synthase|nr:MBL fold metallo-hydrolase [Dehalococcoidales bacterium]MDP6824771.1 MBL fold metallo-hydrolase [Dehalococcoidales bacterium]
MKLRITTSMENTAGVPGLLSEWGLSFLVETEEKVILFDTRYSLTASHNTNNLSADLKQVDKIVLSHGHYDHTDGLRQILCRIKKEVKVIAHPDIWTAKYHRRKKEKDKYVGIPFQRKELENLSARFSLTPKPLNIADNIITTGEVPVVTDYEKTDSMLFAKEDSGWQLDKLLDDISLIITTELGLLVMLIYAHHGIINTLYHTQQLTGVKRIHAILGSAHLISASRERVQLTIAALKGLDVQRLDPSHYTSLQLLFNNTDTIVDPLKE